MHDLDGHAPLQGLLLVLATLLLMLHATQDLNERRDVLPTGCDKFGYLNMARAIEAGTLFEQHSDRPFGPALIEHLRSSSYPVEDYAWLIAPHAYHVDERTFMVINQYPPGTALLLSPFPVQVRRLLFPSLCVLLWVVPLFAALRWGGRLRFLPAMSIVCVTALALVSVRPFARELPDVTSVAPTYGLVLASGYLLRLRPRWAIALLGATCLFRVANVLLFPAALLALLPASSLNLRQRVTKGIKGTLLGLASLLAGGLGLYLLYATILLGNPLASTYSPIDREFSEVGALAEHVRFYLSLDQQWFVAHLAALSICLAAAVFVERRVWWFGVALAAVVLNYTFYLTHKIVMHYYPYATALFVLGIGLQPLLTLTMARGRWTRWSLHTLAAAWLAVALARARLPDARAARAEFDRQIASYRDAFGAYDVIWAAERSGTVEYATNRAGFRYTWGPAHVRREIIRWLATKGFSQVIWLDDIPDLKHTSPDKLGLQDVSVQLRSHPELGRYVELRAVDNHRAQP